MPRDPNAFVVGPIALASDQARWGVRSGSDATWYGRYPSLNAAAHACSSSTGQRFVRVCFELHVNDCRWWDCRLGEHVSEDEMQLRIRRATRPPFRPGNGIT